ncbi:MAG: 50S ribosomal protein L29 [Candidatus Rehaiarchaeum fermentans]|nr:50S ribosomal protein L29 [Candidatus Rehaiarchaeum fermentans]
MEEVKAQEQKSENKQEKKEEKKQLVELQMELFKMNIKREQGLSPQEAGKYRRLKREIARLKGKNNKQ